jgi:hypothetical protein
MTVLASAVLQNMQTADERTCVTTSRSPGKFLLHKVPSGPIRQGLTTAHTDQRSAVANLRGLQAEADCLAPTGSEVQPCETAKFQLRPACRAGITQVELWHFIS